MNPNRTLEPDEQRREVMQDSPDFKTVKAADTKKLTNLLTVCNKAGMLSFGFDAAKEAALSGKARLILVTSDASAKTVKEISYYCGKVKVKVPVVHIDYTMPEVHKHIGRKAAVLSVKDDGFAKRVKSIIGEEAYD